MPSIVHRVTGTVGLRLGFLRRPPVGKPSLDLDSLLTQLREQVAAAGVKQA